MMITRLSSIQEREEFLHFFHKSVHIPSPNSLFRFEPNNFCLFQHFLPETDHLANSETLLWQSLESNVKRFFINFSITFRSLLKTNIFVQTNRFYVCKIEIFVFERSRNES